MTNDDDRRAAELVERVAKAMWESSSLQLWDGPPKHGSCRITGVDRQIYRDHARAAIAAATPEIEALAERRGMERALAIVESETDHTTVTPFVHRHRLAAAIRAAITNEKRP